MKRRVVVREVGSGTVLEVPEDAYDVQFIDPHVRLRGRIGEANYVYVVWWETVDEV